MDVYYCHNYQRPEGYKKDAPHTGKVGKYFRQMQHICAACWMKNKAQNPHPECSIECPLKEA